MFSAATMQQRAMYPRKIHVEITTRCNLHCRMCVKHAQGSCISEEDLPAATFRRLAQALAHADKLVLNGIGEPLLHPRLDELLRFARKAMKVGGKIGFQSNGLLLDERRAEALIKAGLSTICLSLDRIKKVEDSAGEHQAEAVERAIAALDRARRTLQADLTIGLEMVLHRETIADLPDMVEWAAGQKVDYLMATHLLLYDEISEKLDLFNPNPAEAIQLFQKHEERAASRGINLARHLPGYFRLSRQKEDRQAAEIFAEMQVEARKQDVRLHLQSLVRHRENTALPLGELYKKAEAAAARRGLELFLPALEAQSGRSCIFMNDEATFVAANGDVMPCHFLWHNYTCRVLQEAVAVRKRTFGNIARQCLLQIWQSENYRQFRDEASRSQYAPCWTCSQGPCPTLVNDEDQYANDCFGSRVPCGHCQWNLGGVRCM